MRNTTAPHWFLLVALLASPGCTSAPNERVTARTESGVGGPQIESDHGQHVELKTGLRIETGINRGTGYTDSQGTAFNLRYRPVTVTNGNAVPIRLQISFSEAYEYPEAHAPDEFGVIPMPGQWALDGVEITDGMIEDLQNYVDNPSVDRVLEPGEELVMAIGTRYRPTGVAALPGELFARDDVAKFQECENLIGQNQSTGARVELGLKLDIYFAGHRQPSVCLLVPCGQISVSER